MAKLIIDVSGKKALGPKFYGDIYRSTANPNYRYIGQEGQLAYGIFNPYMRDGYLSPANASFKQITRDGGNSNFGNILISTVIDQTTNKWIGLRDDILVVPSNNESTDVTSYDPGLDGNGSDLEMYIINNNQFLFAVSNQDIIIYDSTNNVSGPDWLSGSYVSSATVTGSLSGGVLSVSDNTGYASSGGLIIDGKLYRYTGKGSTTSFTGVTPASATIANGTPIYQSFAGGGAQLVDFFANRLVKSGVFMYVLNKNFVHRIDGTTTGGPTGTFTPNVLGLPSNLYFYDGVDYGGSLYFAINTLVQSENPKNIPTGQYPLECAVGVWNKTSLGFTSYIVVPGMRQLKNIFIAPDGSLRLFGIRSNGEVSLMKYSGSRFEEVLELPSSSHPSYWDSLQVSKTQMYWYGYDGSLYSYGANNVGDPEILSIFFDWNTLNSANYSGSGSFSRGGAMILTQNSSTPSAGEVQIQDSLIFGLTAGSGNHNVFRYLPYTTRAIDGVSPVCNIGNTYTMVQLLPLLSKVNYIRSVHLQTTGNNPANSIATLKAYFNQSSTPFGTWTVSEKDGFKGYKYMPTGPKDRGGVYSIQVEIEWNPSQAIGSNNYCPIYFEVDYEPDTKLM